MTHGVNSKPVGHSATSADDGDDRRDGEDVAARRIELSAADSRCGTWKLTWRGDTYPSDVYARTFHCLFERQLSAFSSPRVFVLGKVSERELADIEARAAAVAVGEANHLGANDFDVVWDAGMLSRVPLAERLQLVQALDNQLRVGGSCIIVAHDQSATNSDLAYVISPEEIAAYFFPAYVVARHEEHEFALPPGSPVTFHTLVLIKRHTLTVEMLDLELHRSLHAVARRRRELTR